jgi:hypothetical protein
MRRYGELSRGAERSSPRQFSPDCTIAMCGYDFREGHLLNPSHEKQNDKDDQDDADESDATVTIPVPIAAEAATESTKQEDYENDNENESERHGGVLSFQAM